MKNLCKLVWSVIDSYSNPLSSSRHKVGNSVCLSLCEVMVGSSI